MGVGPGAWPPVKGTDDMAHLIRSLAEWLFPANGAHRVMITPGDAKHALPRVYPHWERAA